MGGGRDKTSIESHQFLLNGFCSPFFCNAIIQSTRNDLTWSDVSGKCALSAHDDRRDHQDAVRRRNSASDRILQFVVCFHTYPMFTVTECIYSSTASNQEPTYLSYWYAVYSQRCQQTKQINQAHTTIIRRHMMSERSLLGRLIVLELQWPQLDTARLS